VPGKPITSIPWDSLPGKWIVAESIADYTQGGMLTRVEKLDPGSIFRTLFCCPYYIVSNGAVTWYAELRLATIALEGWRYTVYDDLLDMRDDVMLAFLSKKGYPPIMLALEIPEFRASVGIDHGVYRQCSPRDARLSERFRNDQP
jgi:hypothetical protein